VKDEDDPKFEKPGAKAAVEKPGTKAAVEKPAEKATFEKPTAAFEPLTAAFERPAEKAAFERPAEKAAFEKPAEKAAFEKPTEKAAFEKPATSAEKSGTKAAFGKPAAPVKPLEGKGDVPVPETPRRATTTPRAAVKAPAARLMNDVIATLDPGVPLVLLPVRLETRFVPVGSGAKLLVRIYPDEIFADGHEPELTADERRAGRDFHAKVGGDALGAWRRLVLRFSAARSAWIVRATAPGASDPGTRDATWTRAVRCALLPDRWRVRVLRHDGTGFGGPVTAWHLDVDSGPVHRALALSHTPPPRPVPGAPEVEPPLFDDDVLWTVDFERAKTVGMAVEIDLAPYDLEVGIDRVVVLGLCDTTPEQGDDALTHLLDAQHYTRGLAFVPQGTPAHSTPDRPAGYPPSDAPQDTLRVEYDASEVTAASDGGRLARALGLDARVFEHVDGHARTEGEDAGVMNRALWPATLGYFLAQIVHPRVEVAAIVEARAWFKDHVRAAGPLPTIRVGRVPYGVLPASSLRHWVARGDSPLEKGLVPMLRALHQRLRREVFPRAGTPSAPHVGRTEGDPDRDLLEILGMDGGAREVRVRPALGIDTVSELLRVLGIDPAEVTRRLLPLRSARAPSMTGVAGRAAQFFFDVNAGRLTAPLVRAPADSDPCTTPAAYLAALATPVVEGARALRAGWSAGSAAPPLLFTLARHAALRELLRLIDEARIDPARAMTDVERAREAFVAEPEIVDTATTVWTRLEAPPPPGVVEEFAPHRAALQHLSTRPAAELERRLLETLDLCSHRVDAWQTALFTRRLDAMRRARPRGCYVGAYGIVERPAPRPPGARRSDGYVHAPSLDHAATAAVLLDAHLTRRGESAERFQVDLSSARVRRAQEVLDAVRSGQGLGAVLGYQVERDFLERGLAQYIKDMREAYPTESHASARDGEAPLEAVAARDVVDGLRLDAAAHVGRWPMGLETEEHRAGVEAAFAALHATIDAVSDLLTAESVFQVVRGHPTGAAASLDAMARGQRPPDPEVVRTPRGGASVTHRVMLVLPSGDEAAPGWPYRRTPRASLAPALDRWLGELLGNPAEIRCRATWQGSDAPGSMTVSAHDLDLCPLDLAALAREGVPEPPAEGVAQGFGTELERRILLQLPEGARKVRLDFEVEGRTFTEAFEIARAVEDVLGGARALRASDLTLPEQAPTENRAPATGRVGAAARGAVFTLQQALGALAAARAPTGTAAELREALLSATLFDLPSAVPEGFDEPLASLRARASRAEAELLRRLLRAAWPASEERRPDAASVADAVLAAQARAETAHGEVVEALFGRKRVVLPDFGPEALARPVSLNPSAAEVRAWLHKMWRVRAPLARWRRLALYAGALDASTALTVAQLEPRAYGRWVALPFELAADRRGLAVPPSGCVSLVMAKPLGVTGAWTGVLLDEWTEVIPNARELTGIAFHYDDPGAEAPHAVLVAVPPSEGAPWTSDSLFETIDETLGLAQVRALGPQALGDLAQVLPAVYLSANPAGAAISSNFTGLLAADPPPTRPPEASS
jgi:hypothetical protein